MMQPNPPPADIGIGEFSGQLTGRAGHIIYREPPKELTIYWETMVKRDFDGSQSYGVSVTCDFQYWSNPKGEPISAQRQLELLRALREWLHAQGKQSSIDLPPDVTEEPASCLWKGCHRHRLKNYFYCKQHFEISSLANRSTRSVLPPGYPKTGRPRRREHPPLIP